MKRIITMLLIILIFLLTFSSCETYENINKDLIEPQLYICAKEAAAALELLDIKKFKNIIDNIV